MAGRSLRQYIMAGNYKLLDELIKSFDELKVACSHAAASEHHPACSIRKNIIHCNCHVFKCREAVEKANQLH